MEGELRPGRQPWRGAEAQHHGKHPGHGQQRWHVGEGEPGFPGKQPSLVQAERGGNGQDGHGFPNS